MIEHVWREPGECQQTLHRDSLKEEEGNILVFPKGWSREGTGREDRELRFTGRKSEGQGTESTDA